MDAPPRSLLRSRVGRVLTRLANLVLRPIAERGWIGPWAVLEHVGRRSGRHFRTPVAVLEAGDRLVIPVPFGVGTQWVQNVLAAGGATLRWHGRDLQVDDPRLVTWPDVRPLVRRSLRVVVWLTRVRDLVSVRPLTQAADGEASSHPGS